MEAKDKKNEVGRPSKIHAFIEKFEEQMKIEEIEKQVIFLTDSELVFLVNQMLSEEDRISNQTFKRWKAANIGEETDGEDELDQVGKQFCTLYKSALLRQKAALFKRLISPTEGQWQRYAWIIERKFDEWNIRQKSEADDTVQQKSVTIVKNYKGIEKK